MMNREQTCFFSGHRNLPGGRKWEIIEAIAEDSIRNAYRRGVRRFLCGGALGFDTIAAQLVLSLAFCSDIRKGRPKRDGLFSL